MTKKEFLQQKTRDMIEVYNEYGSYTPTFAILYDDGTTSSFATQFDGEQSKMQFDYLMRKICTNPKVIACTFTSEGWASETAKEENKRPSECKDRYEIVTLLYSNRNSKQGLHLFKPSKDGNLELSFITKTHQGRFTDPFLNPCLTNSDKEKVINEFQEHVRGSLCSFYEECHYNSHFLFFLKDIPGAIDFQELTEEEWKDQTCLKQKIKSRCQDPQTIAFLLAYPEDNMFKVLLVSEQTQELFCYETNISTYTLLLKSRVPYTGEFSGFIKEPKIMFCLPGQEQSILN